MTVLSTAQQVPVSSRPFYTRFLSYQALIIGGCALTNVKYGPIEFDQIYDILAIVFFLLTHEFKIPLSNFTSKQIRFVTGFFVLIIAGAIFNYFVQRFYPITSADSILRHPGFISLARLVQYLIAILLFLIIFDYCHRDEARLRAMIAAYVLIAFASSIYGILSYVLMKYFDVKIGGAYGDPVRLRAFFVEGGPYGLFACSALFFLFFSTKYFVFGTVTRSIIALVLIISLTLSASKASISLIAFIVLFSAVTLRPRMVFKWAFILILLSGVIGLAATQIDFFKGIGNYVVGYEQIVQGAETHSDDPNLILGRAAGAVIVPEMIAQNPIFGVGIGNYSLTRDTPSYRGLVPPTDQWDLPSLGLFGDLAEIGIPAGILISLFFAFPVFRARKAGMPIRTVWLCFLPFSTLLFGTQLNFTYPWILCALSMSILYQNKNKPPT